MYLEAMPHVGHLPYLRNIFVGHQFGDFIRKFVFKLSSKRWEIFQENFNLKMFIKGNIFFIQKIFPPSERVTRIVCWKSKILGRRYGKF